MQKQCIIDLSFKDSTLFSILFYIYIYIYIYIFNFTCFTFQAIILMVNHVILRDKSQSQFVFAF